MNFFSFPSRFSKPSSSSSSSSSCGQQEKVLIHDSIEVKGDVHTWLKRKFQPNRSTSPVALLSVTSQSSIAFFLAIGKASHIPLDKHSKLSPSFAEISGETASSDQLFWEELTIRVVLVSCGGKFVELRFQSLDTLKTWHKALREVHTHSLMGFSGESVRRPAAERSPPPSTQRRLSFSLPLVLYEYMLHAVYHTRRLLLLQAIAEVIFFDAFQPTRGGAISPRKIAKALADSCHLITHTSLLAQRAARLRAFKEEVQGMLAGILASPHKVCREDMQRVLTAADSDPLMSQDSGDGYDIMYLACFCAYITNQNHRPARCAPSETDVSFIRRIEPRAFSRAELASAGSPTLRSPRTRPALAVCRGNTPSPLPMASRATPASACCPGKPYRLNPVSPMVIEVRYCSNKSTVALSVVL